MLASQETYSHAPIIEAVLDIRVRLPFDSSEAQLKTLHDAEKEKYPTVRRPFRVEFRFQKEQDSEPVTETLHRENGFVFSSLDGLVLFQARPDGFSHNRLAPYEDWDSFRSEARRLWTKYRGLARPEVIEMLGLTYINRIDLPVGGEISEYLRTYIQVPMELPQGVEAHNLFIQMTDEKSEAKIAIAVTLGTPEDSGNVPFTLNIQAFRQVNRQAADLTEDEIWLMFETLRALKNLAFESSVTEKIRKKIR